MPVFDLPERKKNPGLYLHLFHGRPTLDENMEDWGCDGPDMGPLEYVHVTYVSDVKFQFVYTEDAEYWNRHYPLDNGKANKYRNSLYGWLRVVQDCIELDGIYYGDWSVYVVPKKETD